MTERDTRKALHWIVDRLEERSIPFVVVGGLAARAHGATRPLHDIDLYVPGERLRELGRALAEHVVRAPEHHRDEDWDLVFAALEYAGQRIELGDGTGGRFRDRARGEWVDVDVDFDDVDRIELCGRVVPVMRLGNLVAYKRALDREVDRRDLQELGADGAG